MTGRRLSEGLHQAIEAKEKCANTEGIENNGHSFFTKLLQNVMKDWLE